LMHRKVQVKKDTSCKNYDMKVSELTQARLNIIKHLPITKPITKCEHSMINSTTSATNNSPGLAYRPICPSPHLPTGYPTPHQYQGVILIYQ
jgi:hypothetical protein